MYSAVYRLAIMAMVGLISSVLAAPDARALASTVSLLLPKNGTVANATFDSGRHYGIDETAVIDGAYYRQLDLTLTYPTGSQVAGGQVTGFSPCEYSTEGQYLWSYTNEEPGVYQLAVNVTQGVPVPDQCDELAEVESAVFSVAWE
jgi:uncharacterized protein (DUF2141 family)